MTEILKRDEFAGGHVRVQAAAGNRVSRVDYSPFRGRVRRADFDGGRS